MGIPAIVTVSVAVAYSAWVMLYIPGVLEAESVLEAWEAVRLPAWALVAILVAYSYLSEVCAWVYQ